MSRTRARFAVLAAVVLAALLGSSVASAAPVTPAQQFWSGQAAVTRLGARLPAVATANGLSAAELRNHLLTDSTLSIDGNDTLRYVEPAISNVTAAAATTPFDGSIPTSDAFLLHSKPGANRVIYLDFDGHLLSNNAWYSGDCTAAPYNIDGNAASFGTSERNSIISVWKRVAEDYAAFDVDVTTEDPGYAAINRANTSDTQFGTRLLVTNGNDTVCPNGSTVYSIACGGGCGGVAYVGVYDNTGTNHDFYQPAFVFTEGTGGTNAAYPKYIAEAASHEIGHNIGLSHDGCVASCGGYYQGHASWAPIMGVGYYVPIVQWSKGEYADANNTQDDFVVAGTNGLPLRADDHGNTAGTATVLTGTTLSADGVISTRTDVDAFTFDAGAGSATVTVSPVPTSPDLDVKIELRDSGGTLIASNDPASGGSGDSATGMSASVTATLAGGTYTLLVDGVGYGAALNTGYSDYGSVGNYRISGTVPAPTGPPTARITATPTSGTNPLTVSFDGTASTDPDGGTLTYAWDFGDSSGTSTSSTPSYTYTNVGTYTATLTVTDGQNLTGTATVTITVNAPQPPTARITTSTTTGNAPLAVSFGGSTSSDPEGGTLTYAWDFGDSSGTSTAANPSYTYSTPGSYTVTLTVTDPQALTDTATTTITVTAAPVTLTFTNDTHVLDGKNATKNYATATTATIRSGASGSNGWYFLQLDTGGTTTVTKAVLRIRMSGARNTTTPLVVKAVGTSWVESVLTWNNKPTPGTQIATGSVVGSTAAFYEFDITSYVNAQRAAGQPVNIVVQASQATSAAISATTGESTTIANRPQLVITP